MVQCGGIDMNKNPIKAVIFGLGNQAFEHLNASLEHQEVQIVAGVEKNIERHEQVCKKFPTLNLQFFETLEALRDSSLEYDALILALPHDVYGDKWNDILSLGKPMLKEKPLGRDYQEAKTFMDKAREAGCGLQTAIQRRHHASYQYLAQFLKDECVQIYELHAHLHLGKGLRIADKTDPNWRDSRQKSGGGALLDAGCHLVDLVQFIVGDFEVISATMWNGTKADNGADIEDRCWLKACALDTWIMLDTWVQGESDGKGGFKKSEMIVLNTNKGIICANREGVWCEDDVLFETSREWEEAMQNQLTQFAQNVRSNHWADNAIWDQLPAMRTIDKAYWLSKSY